MIDLRFDGATLAFVVQTLLLEDLLVRIVVALEVQKLLRVSRERSDHLILDQHDITADVVQEVSVVRDDHQRLVVRLQERLQPNHRADIQVVRWLIQQEQVGG